MSRNTKISAALVAVFVAATVLVAVFSGGDGDDETLSAAGTTTTAQEADAATSGASPASPGLPRVVANDPRRLGSPGRGGVTFTEFLDFECEACGAAFPVIEQLREAYEGRVTFNIRYFPLPGHKNSRPAALAVEAASQQGQLEPMYKKMYKTQSEWGEKSDSQADLFRDFAKQLGLDMARFDAALANPKTIARVDRDVAAGTALGIQGTPTFYIDEQRIEPESVDDIRKKLDDALEGS